MESTGHVSVPLRTGKKMKKRKELDALVANSVTKRSCVTSKRNGAGGGVSSQDQLLSDSTDEQEYWVAGATKRPRVRLTRRRPCGSLFRACSVILMFACVIATTTVLWLFIDIREQITALRSELDQVVASSQGVPDALQRCHTLSKNLQQNQTLISSQIAALKLQIENFTKEMTEMQTGLNKIQEKLNHVPEYLNVPQQLSSMSSSIANLGSQIKDITTTVASLKDSKEKLESTSNNLKQNLTDLRQSVILIQNTTQIPATVNTENNAELENMMKAIDSLKNNVSNINTTLSNNVQWIRDDQLKNKKSIESISNIGQNMSARVTTLEGICTKTQEDQLTFSSGLKNLTEEYNSLLNTVKKHTSQLIGLENDVTQLSQNSSDLSTAIRFLNRSISDNRLQDADSLHERELPRGTATAGSSTATSTASTSTAVPTKPPILRE